MKRTVKPKFLWSGVALATMAVLPALSHAMDSINAEDADVIIDLNEKAEISGVSSGIFARNGYLAQLTAPEIMIRAAGLGARSLGGTEHSRLILGGGAKRIM